MSKKTLDKHQCFCTRIAAFHGVVDVFSSGDGGYMLSSNKWALRFGFLAFFMATLLLSPDSGNAQLSAGSVTGVVPDATGSGVLRASGALRTGDTPHHHTTQSTYAGTPRFSYHGPGQYAL